MTKVLRGSRAAAITGLVLAAALTLAACSSSSKKDTAGGATTPPASGSGSSAGGGAAAPTGSTIKIGGYIEQTGTDGDEEKPAVGVAKAWVKWVNANGGINGHPVSITISDTGATSATAIASATAMADDKSLSGVLLLSGSQEGTVGPIFEKAGLPVFGMGYLPTVWNTLPNFFTGETVIPGVIQLNNLAAKETGATVIGVDVCAENPACAEAGPLFQGSAEALGMKYGGLVKTSATQPSFTAECLQFIHENVDYIHLAVTSGPGTLLAEECLKQGYKGQFGVAGLTINNATLSKSPNLPLAGDITAFPWWSTNSVVTTFTSAMSAGGLTPIDYQNQVSVSAWSALEMFRAAAMNAVPAATTATAALVVQGFGSIKNNNFGGLLAAPVSFTAGKPSAPVYCAYVWQRKPNGTFTSPKGDLVPSCLPTSMQGH